MLIELLDPSFVALFYVYETNLLQRSLPRLDASCPLIEFQLEAHFFTLYINVSIQLIVVYCYGIKSLLIFISAQYDGVYRLKYHLFIQLRHMTTSLKNFKVFSGFEAPIFLRKAMSFAFFHSSKVRMKE